MNAKSGLVVWMVVLAVGCTAVKQAHVAPDWKTADATRVKRLVVVVAPAPKGDLKLAAMFGLMARNYVNLKREFIVKANTTAALPTPPEKFDPKGLCGPGIEGVLWLAPTVLDQGQSVHEEVEGKLLRCPDGAEVWGAHAEGTWKSSDTALAQMSGNYVKDLGPGVAPYLAPTFHLLKPTLDTLPNPTLTDEEQVEKTESD